jgi:AmmeMemoRadiSam system protein A
MTRLDDEARNELLKIARGTLDRALLTGQMPEYPVTRPELLEHAGAFVSLHEGEDLRGCIGHISPDRELYKVVQSCAVSAALEDTRFRPVAAEELPLMTIEISVLTPLQPVSAPDEIEVGKHGLYVVRGFRRGLLLPQVATQYGWDRETFLSETCRKAGLPENAWRDRAATIFSFEAQVFSE